MQFNLNIDSINYIKFVYKDAEGATKCTKAAIKRMGEREIFACAKFEKEPKIKTPQNISLSFVCENGLYRTNTILKYIEKDEPYMFFGITTPKGIEYQQNREYFRVKMAEDAVLSFEKDNNMTVLRCKTYDISASGVRLIIDEPISQPNEVNINILFSSYEVKLKAEFVRFDNDDDILKASFKYTDISEKSRDVISQKCIQRQLEYKRNSLK